MTVSTTTSRVSYTGDGITVAFAVPFPFFSASDLAITERVIATGAETIKALGTNYTVAGGAGATGTVTALVAPSASVQWIIVRALPFTQLIDYVSNDGFPAESHEAGLDRAAMRDQELHTAVARTLRLPVTDPDGLNVELPAVPVRAGKVLGFDANGNLIVVVDIPAGSINLPLPIADGGTGAMNAEAARTALAVAGLADANVFTADQVIEKTDAGAAEGPLLVMRRISASPAASDKIGGLAMDGKDGAGNTERYAQIHAEIVDATHNSEDAQLAFFTQATGGFARRIAIGAGVQAGTPTGGDPGMGWVNVSGGYKVNNIEIGGALAGMIVARSHASTASVISCGTIPEDNSVPQSGEGSEIVAVTHTPKASANRLLVRAALSFGKSNSGFFAIMALFKDSESGARQIAYGFDGSTSGMLMLEYEMEAGTTSPIEFKVRAGASGNNLWVNGDDSGTRLGGGAARATITVEEVKA